MWKLQLASFVILGIIICFCVEFIPVTSGQRQKTKPQTVPIRLQDRLREIGNRFDCYFTIETGLTLGNRTESIEGKILSEGAETTDLEHELQILRNEVPNLYYQRDTFNNKIIHIIDKRLKEQNGYSMDQVIPAFRFYGTRFDFVIELRRRGIPISPKGMVDTYEALGHDMGTLVNVNGKSHSVRQLLSDGQTLNESSRILWIARTELGQKQTTYIHYLK